ncbi:MAG: ROK family protein [Candidatus Bathyarchaeota archaeon]|nr:ROK family protein [Candidatus Bathyarchaeota archaeon]
MRYAIGVDIGATNTRVALGSDSGKFLEVLKERTPKTGGNKAIPLMIRRMIDRLLETTGKRIEGIGIGSIGPLKGGCICKSPNIPFSKVDLRILKRFRKPVYLLNDCSAAVLGEKLFGAGKKHDNLVYITMSSGVGAGAIVDGRLLSGVDGNAAEVGHFNVDTEYSVRCNCGHKGHWEAYASGKTMPRFWKAWLKKHDITTEDPNMASRPVCLKAQAHERVAYRFIKDLAKINARAISDVIVAYSPSLITLGGPVALNHSDVIVDLMKTYVDKFLKTPIIRTTPLRHDSVLYGALALAFMKEGVRL